MKKLLSVIFLVSLIAVSQMQAQGFLNKVKNAVSKEITGVSSGSGSANVDPEPECACEAPALIISLSKFKINYREMNVGNKKDGSILIQDRETGKSYVVRDGVTSGPYESGDPAISGFDAEMENSGLAEDELILVKFKGYITKSGEKFLIKFNGKSYGPYAQIHDFTVPKSNDNFAALVVENVVTTENDTRKMEDAINNAKTEEERMQLAMKFGQEMAQRTMDAGGAEGVLPKMVTNVAGAVNDPTTMAMGKLNSTAKYDEIVMILPDKAINLQGKTLITLGSIDYETESLFISSDNKKYATFDYGTLTFSDKTTLAEVFNPYLTKKDGKVYLTYMYYSPGKNAIMQCYLPF